MDEVPGDIDRQYAEWFAWARREVSADERVCHGVAAAALEASKEHSDREEVERVARSSVMGRAAVLSQQAGERRRQYAHWYDWGRRNLGGNDSEAWHRAALAALEGAAAGRDDHDLTLVAARAASESADASAQLRLVDGDAVRPESWLRHPPPPPPADESELYAPLGSRAAAALVDVALLVTAMLIMVSAMYAVFGLGQGPTPSGFWIYIAVFGLALAWFYRAAMQGSNLRATVGGWIVGLAVVDSAGKTLTFSRAGLRSLVSVATLGLGLLLVRRAPDGQALADMVVGSRVIRREYAPVAEAAISYLADRRARAGLRTVS